MTAPTLVDLLRPLPELGRVSRMRIEYQQEGWWLVIQYVGMLDAIGQVLRPREPAGWELLDESVIAVDWDRMPDGVSVDIRRARPRARHRLSLDGADPHSQVLALLRALDASGIVGHLNVARVDVPDQGGPQWKISTHAGSDAERHAWLLAIP